MELLREYGSESSEDDDTGAEQAPPQENNQAPPRSAMPQQHVSTQPAAAPIAAADELERRRQAIASALAHQASVTHHVLPHVQRRRMTQDERAFEYRGYASKRRRCGADEQRQQQLQPPPPTAARELQPLFATARMNRDDDGSVSASAALPTRFAGRLQSHTGAVNCVQWSPTHADLFLTASMDGSVRIWDSRQQEPCRRVLTQHNKKGVKSAKWSLDGTHILSGGYDGHAVYTDAETATALHSYDHRSSDHQPTTTAAVTSVCAHPSEPNLFLAGTDRGCIYSYDLRQPNTTACRTYSKAFGDVHDLLFLPDSDDATNSNGQRFVSSAGVKYRDASHQTLLVWDFRSSTLLSDRLDRDMQPFQSLRLHPHKRWFVAQSSGDFVLFFSAKAPFKRLNKGRSRLAGGHEVQGFGVQCSFSSDGSVLATGDANGRVFFYDTTTKRVLQKLEAFTTTACLCAEFQPMAGGRQQLVAGGFDGQLLLYK